MHSSECPLTTSRKLKLALNCFEQLLKPLAALNLKNKTESENDASITHGLIDAVQTFFVCPGQKKRIVNDFSGKGRIICLTSFDRFVFSFR